MTDFPGKIRSTAADGKIIDAEGIDGDIARAQLSAGVRSTLTRADVLRAEVPQPTSAAAGQAVVVNQGGDGFDTEPLSFGGNGTAVEHLIEGLQDKTSDLHAGRPATGWTAANADGSEGGIAVAQSRWTLTTARAASTFTTSLDSGLEDRYLLVRLPFATDPRQAQVEFSGGPGTRPFDDPLNSLQLIGSSEDNQWRFYLEDEPLGAVTALALQVTGDLEHLGETVFSGVFDGDFSARLSALITPTVTWVRPTAAQDNTSNSWPATIRFGSAAVSVAQVQAIQNPRPGDVAWILFGTGPTSFLDVYVFSGTWWMKTSSSGAFISLAEWTGRASTPPRSEESAPGSDGMGTMVIPGAGDPGSEANAATFLDLIRGSVAERIRLIDFSAVHNDDLAPGYIERAQGHDFPDTVSVEWTSGEVPPVTILSPLTFVKPVAPGMIIGIELVATGGGGGVAPGLTMDLRDDDGNVISTEITVDRSGERTYHELDVTQRTTGPVTLALEGVGGSDSGLFTIEVLNVLGFTGTGSAARLIAQVANRITNLAEFTAPWAQPGQDPPGAADFTNLGVRQWRQPDDFAGIEWTWVANVVSPDRDVRSGQLDTDRHVRDGIIFSNQHTLGRSLVVAGAAEWFIAKNPPNVPTSGSIGVSEVRLIRWRGSDVFREVLHTYPVQEWTQAEFNAAGESYGDAANRTQDLALTISSLPDLHPTDELRLEMLVNSVNGHARIKAELSGLTLTLPGPY